MAKQEQVIIFDTTLRDGEQSPGATMHMEEKLLVAEALDAMGVDVIEAGFAIASQGDAGAIQQISKVVKNATICSLARALRKDIDAAGESLKHAKKKRIHTFISTSPLHMEFKLKMSPEKVLEAITDSVSYAGKYTDDVEWSCEDGSRSEHDFLCRAIETAIKAGAKTINIPDTVGYAVPEEYAALIRMVKNRVPNIDKAIISVHCHNDLGLAVANSLAALGAGARQIECTVNGLGERAGNAAMEEIVMGIRTRSDLLPFKTNIKTEHITRISRLVSQVTGFAVQKNKSIVGANAFAHESGIHQHGMLANRNTYEIMTPESVGLSKSELVLGKHSGRHAFVSKLKEMGVELGDTQVDEVFEQFKALADRKKEIYDEDILSLISPNALKRNRRLQFKELWVECGSKGQKARLTLAIDGEDYTATTNGNGPVDATFKAIGSILPHEATLQLYQVHAVTKGTDAQAEVTVQLSDGKRKYNGHSADPDTLVASAQAYIHALNHLIDAHEKQGESFQPTSYSQLQKSGLVG
jgi:2-isopropylmalate synthase